MATRCRPAGRYPSHGNKCVLVRSGLDEQLEISNKWWRPSRPLAEIPEAECQGEGLRLNNSLAAATSVAPTIPTTNRWLVAAGAH